MSKSNAAELAPHVVELNHWMFESSPDCVKLLDLDGCLLAMNRNGQRCMEIDDFNGVCGALWSTLWPEDSRLQIEAAVNAARSGRVGHFSAFCPTAKGTPKWWDVMVTPVLDTQGRVERLLSVSRDVTRVHEAQQELREAVSRLQFTLESAEVGDWDLDLVNDVARRSLRHDQCYGYSEPLEHWGFATFIEHVHPEDRRHVRDSFEAAVHEGKDWKFESRVIWPDGSTHWISAHGSIYFTMAGKPVRMLGIVNDITDRKRAEAVAQGQKKAFELAVASAPLADILDTLARAAEAGTGNTLMASLLLLDAEGKRLRYGAGPSLPASYNQAIDGTEIGPEVGSCGTAAYLCEPVIVSDIDSDPRWAGFRALAQPLGLRACWSIPIVSSQGKVLGTLASYCREAREPSEQEWASMKLLANTASLVLEQRREIEERQAAQEALRLSEERFRSLVVASSAIVWRTSAAGQFEEDQPEWRAFTGQSFEELRGNGWLQAIHAADQATTLASWTESVRTGRFYQGEQRLRQANGQYRHMSVRAAPILRHDGTIREWVGLHLDLTELKQAEEELRANEERVRLATESAGLGVWTWDLAADQVTWENDRMYEISGLSSSAEPINAERLASEFLHPDDVALFREAVAATVERGVPLHFEGRYRRPDGILRWIELTGRIQPHGEDEPPRMVGMVADITERKQAEESLRRLAEELAEADRRKTEFLATLAHELRNPLAPIRTGLEVMRLSSGNSAAAARTREMMERQISHMVHLVDDLLDVARITRGKLELKKEVVELKSVVTSAVETSLPLIEAGCHDLSVHTPEESLLLEVDPIRIAQVVSNLLNNAAKYTPTGGRIDLRMCRQGGEVLISVSDTGVGLPPEGLSTVFQMFAQLGQNMERAQGGLGIGLTLVRQLVELHGGTVAASSPGLGQGSTFTVRLPLLNAESPESHGTLLHAEAAGARQAQHLRILVVDDNVDAAETLSSLLAMIGHTTRVAHDGTEALQRTRDFQPDVVFLDIGLPGMSGYEVAQALRRIAGREQTVLVALTGWGADNDRARSREAGFDQHLTKPADLAAITALLLEVGQSRHQARRPREMS